MRRLKTFWIFSLVFTSMLMMSFQCNEKFIDTNVGKLNIIPELNGDGSKNLVLQVRTEEIFPCVNYNITFIKNEASNTVNIQFTGINKPDICLTALGPASANIELNNLLMGNNHLVIIANGMALPGIIINEVDKYTINWTHDDIINISPKVVQK